VFGVLGALQVRGAGSRRGREGCVWPLGMAITYGRALRVDGLLGCSLLLRRISVLTPIGGVVSVGGAGIEPCPVPSWCQGREAGAAKAPIVPVPVRLSMDIYFTRLGYLGRLDHRAKNINVVQYAPRAVSNPQTQPTRLKPTPPSPFGGCQVCRFCKNPASVDVCATMRWLHCRYLAPHAGGRADFSFAVSVAAPLGGLAG
jgi:hypothetical protein